MIWHRIIRYLFRMPVSHMGGCPVGEDTDQFWDYYDDDFECS